MHNYFSIIYIVVVWNMNVKRFVKEAAKWNAIKSDGKMNRVSLKMCGFFLANLSVEVVSLQYQLGQSHLFHNKHSNNE